MILTPQASVDTDIDADPAPFTPAARETPLPPVGHVGRVGCAFPSRLLGPPIGSRPPPAVAARRGTGRRRTRVAAAAPIAPPASSPRPSGGTRPHPAPGQLWPSGRRTGSPAV